VQLGLTHRALETQQEAIVKVTGVVDAILVEDERLGEGADFQEPVPVRRIARQARHLQPHHEPHAAEADLGDEALKALALDRRGARQPEVLVDHDDLIGGPAEGLGPPLEVILTSRTLAVIVDLLQRGLPHVEVGLPAQMVGRHLACGRHHVCLPAGSAHARTKPAKTVVSSARAAGSSRGARSARGSSTGRLGRDGTRAVSAVSHAGRPRATSNASP